MMTFETFFNEHCRGEIEFLQQHKQIAELIFERTKEQSIEDWKLERMKENHTYGFIWDDTIEGFTFWSCVMKGDTEKFYNKYPKKLKVNEVD